MLRSIGVVLAVFIAGNNGSSRFLLSSKPDLEDIKFPASSGPIDHSELFNRIFTKLNPNHQFEYQSRQGANFDRYISRWDKKNPGKGALYRFEARRDNHINPDFKGLKVDAANEIISRIYREIYP